MDEQLRTQFFEEYCVLFDTFLKEDGYDAELFEEFIRFSSHNHTQAIAYGKTCSLRQTVELKIKEVFKEMESRNGKPL